MRSSYDREADATYLSLHESADAGNTDVAEESRARLIHSLLEMRRQMEEAGVPSLETWEDLEHEIANRRGQPAHERAS